MALLLSCQEPTFGVPAFTGTVLRKSGACLTSALDTFAGFGLGP